MPYSGPTQIYSKIEDMAAILKAIHNPCAIKIVMLLLTSEKRICELSKLSSMNQVVICHQIKRLQKAGIVQVEKKNSRNSVCSITGRPREGMAMILQTLRTFKFKYAEDV